MENRFNLAVLSAALMATISAEVNASVDHLPYSDEVFQPALWNSSATWSVDTIIGTTIEIKPNKPAHYLDEA